MVQDWCSRIRRCEGAMRDRIRKTAQKRQTVRDREGQFEASIEAKCGIYIERVFDPSRDSGIEGQWYKERQSVAYT